ncbi:MAG: ATP-binding protein [Flavobacteriales bacterium]|nr:ATP-binding protein [Flavobacteriales bacterium]
MPATQRMIQFPSAMENINLVEKLIDEVCAEFQVKEDYYGELLIGMTEAVNNAMVHGNKLDPSKQVKVLFDVVEDKFMRFTVEDEGPGFDYHNLPDPTAPENIEKPHGRGVFLMRQLSDRCEFQDGGRIVILDFAVLEQQPA